MPIRSTDAGRGALMAVVAYGAWGLLPIFWKQLAHVPAIEVLAHRVMWSMVFVAIVLALRRGWSGPIRHLRDPVQRRLMLLSTVLIGTNWGIFIWAVSASRITDASLGYYINPLLNVAIGRVFLGERMRPLQVVSVVLAAIGVAWLAVMRGSLPWVSLALATTFCLYGLVRKRATVGAMDGLAIETALIAPVAFVYVLLLEPMLGAFRSGGTTTMWLVLSGAVTAIPLLAFAGAARRLRFGTLGMLQYIAPTLQLACAVWLYGEPFDRADAVTFGFIWMAVLLYMADTLRARGRAGT